MSSTGIFLSELIWTGLPSWTPTWSPGVTISRSVIQTTFLFCQLGFLILMILMMVKGLSDFINSFSSGTTNASVLNWPSLRDRKQLRKLRSIKSPRNREHYMLYSSPVALEDLENHISESLTVIDLG